MSELLDDAVELPLGAKCQARRARQVPPPLLTAFMYDSDTELE